MNNTEWLKQLKVGDKVCVNNEKIGHVVKITKTMVVLGSGRRFNIKSGWKQSVGKSWVNDAYN